MHVSHYRRGCEFPTSRLFPVSASVVATSNYLDPYWGPLGGIGSGGRWAAEVDHFIAVIIRGRGADGGNRAGTGTWAGQWFGGTVAVGFDSEECPTYRGMRGTRET